MNNISFQETGTKKIIRKSHILTLLLIVMFSYAFAQDEIIEWKTKKALDYDIKIEEITNDTIIFKAFRKIKKMPLTEVAAYHIDSGDKKTKGYIYINPNDTVYCRIKNGKLYRTYETIGFILKRYEVKSENKKSSKCYIEFTENRGNNKEKLKAGKVIRFGLKSDSLKKEINGNLFCITTDSLFLKTQEGKGIRTYGFILNDFSYISFQTSSRVVLSATVGALGAVGRAGHGFFSPFYPKKMDLLEVWSARIIKKNKKHEN